MKTSQKILLAYKATIIPLICKEVHYIVHLILREEIVEHLELLSSSLDSITVSLDVICQLSMLSSHIQSFTPLKPF